MFECYAFRMFVGESLKAVDVSLNPPVVVVYILSRKIQYSKQQLMANCVIEKNYFFHFNRDWYHMKHALWRRSQKIEFIYLKAIWINRKLTEIFF